MSNIQWTDLTINPIYLIREDGSNGGHFCNKVSPGCLHCYSEAQNQSNYFSFASHLKYAEQAPDNLIFDETVMEKLLRMRSGKKVFLCSMTDLFGDWVPDEWIDKAFAYMALSQQHIFQVLTKRPERLRPYLQKGAKQRIRRGVVDLGPSMNLAPKRYEAFATCEFDWPLPNVWLGTSVEDQQVAGDRIPLLLDTPAAIRFLSCEPLLEELNLVSHKRNGCSYNYLLNTWEPCRSGAGGAVAGGQISPYTNEGINQVIIGGESGVGARPCHIDWIQSILQQCQQTKTAVFVKQLGQNSLSYVAGSSAKIKLKDRKGGDMAEWPESIRVRQFPIIQD